MDARSCFEQVCRDVTGHIDEVGSSHQYIGTTGHVEQGQVAGFIKLLLP